ncbi:hypothetical protein MTR_6g488310 [Medicago truncatula]|uniref:Uncharacterized protein n=1 Tax=Medicago truncatula TaxID=3880 RepID=A0A072UBH3_MEDTR|nr:hypothetical protein MTR_6g488310 [Medicago truncatula]
MKTVTALGLLTKTKITHMHQFFNYSTRRNQKFQRAKVSQKRATSNFSNRVLFIELLVCSASQKPLWGFIRHGHAILQSYFIKRPKDISPVYEEGQIPSRTLMSLSMIHQVPINQRYGYPFTDNVRMETKYLSPHLGIIVVSGLRAIYVTPYFYLSN